MDPEWLDLDEAAAWLRFIAVVRAHAADDVPRSAHQLHAAAALARGRQAPGHLAAVRHHLIDALSPAQLVQLRDICESVLERIDPEGVKTAI